MRYLTVEDVYRANEVQSGQHPLGEFGLVESAILRPQMTIGGQDAYPDIHTKAAALLHSLIRNHPFVHANKRTAVVSALAFYGLNGWWVDAEDGELVGLAYDVAEGLLDVNEIAKRLASWAHPRDI